MSEDLTQHTGAIDVYRHEDGRVAAVVAWTEGCAAPWACIKEVDGRIVRFSILSNDDAPWPIRESHFDATFTTKDGGLKVLHPSIADPAGVFSDILKQADTLGDDARAEWALHQQQAPSI